MLQQISASVTPIQSSKNYCWGWLACLLFLGSSSDLFAAENWTSFQNGGQIQLENVQAELKLTKAWDVPIQGYGQSSPVTWEGQLFVTSVSGKEKEKCHVIAFDLANGKEIWKYELKNATPQESSNYISKAAPTPVVDENGLICFFEGGNLLALTHQGELRWERNLVDEYGAIDARHGLSASLEQSETAAFVWVERQTDPYLLAINKKTGENLWKSAGIGVTSWASPRLIPVEGGEHLVLSGVGKLVGVDPETGKVLWEFTDITGNSTPTPIPMGAGRFLMGATVGRGDSDAGRAAESNGVLEISKTEAGKWAAKYVWQAKRATSSFGSPILSNGYCYFVNRAGVMYCLNQETGKEEYAKRIGGSLWATPISLSEKLLLPLKDGTLNVVSSGPDFKEFGKTTVFGNAEATKKGDEAPFGGATLYAGIVVGSKLIIRSGDHLYCLQVH